MHLAAADALIQVGVNIYLRVVWSKYCSSLVVRSCAAGIFVFVHGFHGSAAFAGGRVQGGYVRPTLALVSSLDQVRLYAPPKEVIAGHPGAYDVYWLDGSVPISTSGVDPGHEARLAALLRARYEEARSDGDGCSVDEKKP